MVVVEAGLKSTFQELNLRLAGGQSGGLGKLSLALALFASSFLTERGPPGAGCPDQV